MTQEDNPGRTRPPEAGRLAEEAHLLDLGNLQEIALWVATAVGSGVLGGAGYDVVKDVLKAIRKRFGSDRLAELREQIYRELKAAQRRKHHLSAGDLRARVDRLFDQLER